MKKEFIALAGYTAFIFVLLSLAIPFSVEIAVLYIQGALIVMGITAIVLQKTVHRGRFVDMGFRLNRNALVGLGVGVVFTIVMLALGYWLPAKLNLIELTINQGSPMIDQGGSLTSAGFIGPAVNGSLMFIFALFTEELAFRGYILPKLAKFFGGFKAVLLCAVIFGLWHIPAYYSIYAGGAEELGLLAVIKSAMLGSGLAVIPICILYLTTGELYGVSLSHALFDTFAYNIVATPELGEMAEQAIYSLRILNEPAYETLGWILPVLGIPIMLALCALAKKLLVDRSDPDVPST